MNIEYIIAKVGSYNNKADLENRFPILLDDEISNSSYPVKDLKNLKSDIYQEKLNHEEKCNTNVGKCGTSLMYDSALKIIDNRMIKYKINNSKRIIDFISKYWWGLIIPAIIAIVSIIFDHYFF